MQQRKLNRSFLSSNNQPDSTLELAPFGHWSERTSGTQGSQIFPTTIYRTFYTFFFFFSKFLTSILNIPFFPQYFQNLYFLHTKDKSVLYVYLPSGHSKLFSRPYIRRLILFVVLVSANN
jgi:hypothetical protein